MCTRMIYRLLTGSDELEGCREQGQCQAGQGMEEFEEWWDPSYPVRPGMEWRRQGAKGVLQSADSFLSPCYKWEHSKSPLPPW